MIERKINLGGYSLYLREMGDGVPTIILESAMGTSLGAWLLIQKRLAESTRVIAYDRAGIGKSEKSQNPRTSFFMVQELRMMLQLAGFQPPYILAGASFGGFVTRTYAYLYPDDIVGMVLIESSHEDFLPEIQKRWSKAQWDHFMIKREQMINRSNDSFRDEWLLFSITSDYMRTITFPKMIPIKIITSARYGNFEEKYMGYSKEDIDLKCFLHRQWMHECPNMRQIITYKSGHDIVREEPDLVIQTIFDLLKEVNVKI